MERGDRVGLRVLVKPARRDMHGRQRWAWRCDCGHAGISTASHLRQLARQVAAGESPGACRRCNVRVSPRHPTRKRKCSVCGIAGHDVRKCPRRGARKPITEQQPCTRVGPDGAVCTRSRYHDGLCSWQHSEQQLVDLVLLA